jgi:hypothetical protein
MSMKNSSDTIGNRTPDLPVCSAVPQPTAPPHAPKCVNTNTNFMKCSCRNFFLTLHYDRCHFIERLHLGVMIQGSVSNHRTELDND